MSFLSDRVPGFVVRPEENSEMVNSDETTELEVLFRYSPEEEVRVSIEVPKGVRASAQELTFKAGEKEEVQKVTLQFEEVEKEEIKKIIFRTFSKDEVFDQLEDAWTYMVTGK